MRMILGSIALAALCGVIVIAQTKSTTEASRLQQMAARFAPTDIAVDLSKISPNDRKVLAKLVEASKVMDAIFLRQVWAGNEAMLIELARDESPEGRARLHNFLINKGPWDRLDHNKAFVPGAPGKPAGANFYPEGATKAELENWIKALPEGQRAQATGFFTLVQRSGGGLSLVPYNVAYNEELTHAAALLREAAALATEPTLKNFLTKRAAAFLSNDYYDSDVAWMELKGAVEPTIGPYEVYEDELFNYKAAYEAFITVQDEDESKKLQKFAGELQDIENHLPIDPKYRNPKLGGLAPHNITVGGRATTVRQQMKEASSYLEEAKADISGLFAIQHMIDKGVVAKSLETTLYTTYLASAFRSIRFGVGEAHGRGVAVQFNYLLDAGGFVAEPDGTFRVDLAKVKSGVAGLTRDIMTIQAEGG